MKSYLQILCVVSLVLPVVVIGRAEVVSAQESQAPRVELLTMNGSKPNLSATGEGITSYKIGDLYNRGATQIDLVKPADAPFKIELPLGYSIFNNLIYGVETKAVFTGPTDITFKLPSARTKETFNHSEFCTQNMISRSRTSQNGLMLPSSMMLCRTPQVGSQKRKSNSDHEILRRGPCTQ